MSPTCTLAASNSPTNDPRAHISASNSQQITPTGTFAASNSPSSDPHSSLNTGCNRAIYLRYTELPQIFKITLQILLHIFISILSTWTLLKKKAEHYMLINKQ
jgi:hypothetical protein